MKRSLLSSRPVCNSWKKICSRMQVKRRNTCAKLCLFPTLPTALLCETARALSRPEADMVLGPAEDGGYYLLGVRAPHAHLFRQIDWSTDQVAAQTRARASDLGLESVLLDPWYDVDDRHGLNRLIQDIGERRTEEGHRPYAAPLTAACLSRLGLLAEAPGNRVECIP